MIPRKNNNENTITLHRNSENKFRKKYRPTTKPINSKDKIIILDLVILTNRF
jgi:hypothetical protein